MARTITRRELVQGAALAAGSALVAPYARAQKGPNSALGVAIIGVGGMGGYSVDASLGERIVAICDVDDARTAEALKKIADAQPGKPAPKTYADYRKMLDEMNKDIDAVLIATPDHNHAPASIRAIHMGKATFCQKPLTHDIYEAYTIAKAARAKNVPTQMGNQGHCGEGIRRSVEYLWAGAVGNVTETHTILGRNFGGKEGRPPSKPIPPGLHWQEWIGAAPYRDFHDNLHPFNWRNWRDFGTGTIGDMACHNLDALYWALKVGEAKKLKIECLNTNGGSEEMWAQDNIVRYTVPPRAGMPELKVYVYDHGDLKPQVMKDTEKECDINFGECTLYLGDKGRFWTTHAVEVRGRILPLEKHNEFPPPPVTLPRAHGDGPVDDLFYCVKNGGTPASNFPGSAGPLTAFALLGHLAQYAGVGKVLEWDVEKMRCTNMPEINEHLHRKYRKGWEV